MRGMILVNAYIRAAGMIRQAERVAEELKVRGAEAEVVKNGTFLCDVRENRITCREKYDFCVYLDKDDIDLIVSSGTRVILTPSDSLGHGCGIPPLRMLHTLGAVVSLGTGSGTFNANADLVFEQRLICLAASGILCTPDPVPKDFADSMLRSDGVLLSAKAHRDE